MKRRAHTLHDLIQSRGFRLGSALILAFALFLIPITVQTIIRIPSPSQPHSGPISGATLFQRNEAAVALPLQWGVALVYATNGLTITKSAPATVESGGVITYTLTITNDTGQDITSASVFDVFPSEVTCATNVPSPDWSFGCSSSAAVWTLNPGKLFANNTTIELSFSVDVTQPLTDGHEIVNSTYEITNTTPSFSDAGPAVTTTILAPTWSITKSVSSDSIQPGQTLLYTITATNVGSTATSGSYTISDAVPGNTTLASASAAGLASTTPPTWSFADPLPVSGSKSVTYSVTVNSPLADGTPIVNDGYTVSGGNTIPGATNNAVIVTVDSPVNLSISKTANPDPVGIQQILTYTLTVTNDAATGPADNVVITDTLSSFVTYLSAGFSGGASGTITDTAGNPIIWNLANPIPPNGSVQVTVMAQLSNTLPAPPTIPNNFQASASNASPVSGSMDVNGLAGPVDSVTLSLSPTAINNLCDTTVATVVVRDAFSNLISGTSVSIGSLGGSDAISPTSATGSTNISGVFTTTFKGVKAASLNMLALSGSKTSDLTPLTINTGTPLPDKLNLTVSPDPLSAGGATGVVTATLTDCQTPPQPVSGQAINLILSNPILAIFPGPSSIANGTTNASGVMTTTLTSTPITTASGTITITGTSSGGGWNLQRVVNFQVMSSGNNDLFIPIILKN